MTQKIAAGAFAIFAMDSSHIDALKSRFRNLPERLFRVLDLSEKAKYKDVFDPYGGNLADYTEVRDEIVSAIPSILKYLQNETKA